MPPRGQIALSSGEAELYSNIRGTQELLFIKNVIEEDAGKGAFSLVSKVDASLLRHGVGKLKQLSLKCMWDANAADVLAFASGVTDFVKHIHGMKSWTAVDD